MIRHPLMKTVAAGAACLSLVAAAAGKAAPTHKADVPLDQVPQVVVDAAEKAVNGIALSEAKMRTKKSGVLFKLSGAANDRGYVIKVDAAGKVLDVERDDRPAIARGISVPTRKAAADPPGAIGQSFPGSPAVRVGWIRHPTIRESSGVVASRSAPGVYWTHNDKGNAPLLYAIDREGNLLAPYHVAATHDDWEDIAADGDGNLYLGNIGNNKAQREWLEVHRLREPRPNPDAKSPRPSRSLKIDRTWRLRFPADPFDCEALFFHGAHGYVISKRFDGTPAGLYRFDLGGPDEEVALDHVADLPTDGPVTAADLSPDGNTLAVLTYGNLYTFPVAGDVSTVRKVRPRRVATPPGKLEGVCFAADGDGILVTSEGRDVYHFPTP